MTAQIATTKNLTGSKDNLKRIIQSGLSIRKEQNEDSIKQNLLYCFTLVGLRPEQYPSQLETNVLIDFIFSNYANVNSDEIKESFILALKGEYISDVSKHFGNFSVLYFSNVFNAYLMHRGKIEIEINNDRQRNEANKIIDLQPDELLRIQNDFDRDVVFPIFEQYKNNSKIVNGYTPIMLIYKSLIEFHKIIELSKDDKIKIRQEVESSIEKIEDEHKKQSRIKSLKDILGDSYEANIIEKCQLLVIKKCFDILIQQKRNIF